MIRARCGRGCRARSVLRRLPKSGRNSISLTIVKIAVFAPIPMPMTRTAVAVKVGALAKVRSGVGEVLPESRHSEALRASGKKVPLQKGRRKKEEDEAGANQNACAFRGPSYGLRYLLQNTKVLRANCIVRSLRSQTLGSSLCNSRFAFFLLSSSFLSARAAGALPSSFFLLSLGFLPFFSLRP